MNNAIRNPLVLAGGFVLLVVAALVTPLPGGGREFGAVSDLAHAPVFAVVAFLVHRVISHYGKLGRISGAVLTVLLVTGFGVASEILQHFVGRSANLGDMVSDMLGAVAGVAWSLRATAVSVPARRGLAVLAVGALLLSAVFPTLVFVDSQIQRAEVPQLASFEQPLEMLRWRTRASTIRRVRDHATDGEWSLRIDLEPASETGIVTYCPGPSWADYQRLAFDIELDDGPPVMLVLRIEDQLSCKKPEHRFEEIWQLRSGTRRIEIPMSEIVAGPPDEPLNFKRLGPLRLLVVDLDRPRTLYMDNMHLQ